MDRPNIEFVKKKTGKGSLGHYSHNMDTINFGVASFSLVTHEPNAIRLESDLFGLRLLVCFV